MTTYEYLRVSHARARNLASALVGMLIAILATACFEAPPPHAVASDVSAYIERMKAWAPVEAEAGRSIERILATQFVEDSTMLHELAEGIPRAETHLRRIEAVVPRTTEVAAVHAAYVEAWRRLHLGLEGTQRGIASADGRAVAGGRQAMLDWRRGLRRVAEMLRTLQDEYPDSSRSL